MEGILMIVNMSSLNTPTEFYQNSLKCFRAIAFADRETHTDAYHLIAEVYELQRVASH